MMRIIGIVLCVLALIGIRAIGDAFLYDPFVAYFKETSEASALPEYNFWLLLSNLFLRFWINMGVCLLLIYLLFQQKKLLVVTLYISLVWVVLFMTLYAVQLLYEFPFGDNIAFYNRRFVLHPILGILLLPAFYFQRFQEKNKSL